LLEFGFIFAMDDLAAVFVRVEGTALALLRVVKQRRRFFHVSGEGFGGPCLLTMVCKWVHWAFWQTMPLHKKKKGLVTISVVVGIQKNPGDIGGVIRREPTGSALSRGKKAQSLSSFGKKIKKIKRGTTK